jgi:hypothetical protein
MFAKVIAGALLCAHSLFAFAQYSAQYIETSKAWSSLVADFNNDGHDDIFITGHDEHDRIWYGTESGYVPSAFEFVWVDRHACSAADFNLDGLLDIYCTVGANRGNGMGNNELWIQGAGNVFTKMLGHGAEDPYGRGRYPVFFDFNHDGYPDIYVTNEATIRPDGQVNINHVFVNQAGTGFVEAVTLATGPRGFVCTGKGDVNQDGWEDLVVCHESGPGHVYINNQAGDFTGMVSPALNPRLRDAKLADMNGDGLDDLVLINGVNTLQIWLNTGHAPYFVTPAFERKLVFQSKWLAIGDFNRDGMKDVYVVLQKSDCKTTFQDVAPDVVFEGRSGPTWVIKKQPQAYGGCGHMAETVDGSKVLLLNGGVSYRGPNYVIKWFD